MKVKFEELKKALSWIEENCNEPAVTIEFNNTTNTTDIKCFDRKNKSVTVKVSDESTGRRTTVISEQEIL